MPGSRAILLTALACLAAHASMVAPPDGGTLRAVVILSRHGVRTPDMRSAVATTDVQLLRATPSQQYALFSSALRKRLVVLATVREAAQRPPGLGGPRSRVELRALEDFLKPTLVTHACFSALDPSLHGALSAFMCHQAVESEQVPRLGAPSFRPSLGQPPCRHTPRRRARKRQRRAGCADALARGSRRLARRHACFFAASARLLQVVLRQSDASQSIFVVLSGSVAKLRRQGTAQGGSERIAIMHGRGCFGGNLQGTVAEYTYGTTQATELLLISYRHFDKVAARARWRVGKSAVPHDSATPPRKRTQRPQPTSGTAPATVRSSAVEKAVTTSCAQQRRETATGWLGSSFLASGACYVPQTTTSTNSGCSRP